MTFKRAGWYLRYTHILSALSFYFVVLLIFMTVLLLGISVLSLKIEASEKKRGFQLPMNIIHFPTLVLFRTKDLEIYMYTHIVCENSSAKMEMSLLGTLRFPLKSK